MKSIYPALLMAWVFVLFFSVHARAETGFMEGQFGSSMERRNLVFYHIDGVYHFMPESKFTPFVVAGLGGAHYSPRISAGGMTAFNVGAGVKYTMTDNIGLRVEVRDYMVTEVMQDTYHNVGAMAGITFAFGGGNDKPVLGAQEKLVSSPVESRGIVIDFAGIHFDFD